VNVTEWLLDSDPSIRWQVMRDLTDETAEAVASERSRVAREGWGARLLRLQDEQGQWGGAEFSEGWTSTTYTLLLLQLVRGKRRPDGRWPLENPHEGAVHFDVHPGTGQPSRWNTLRALRVLRWYDRALL
jgi:hypothetical protein